VIPTSIVVGLIAGIFIRRPLVLLCMVVALGIAWGLLVTFSAGADFLGGFAFGVVNAAVGAVLGVTFRALLSGVRSPRRPVCRH
jgi:hypothetical protein